MLDRATLSGDLSGANLEGAHVFRTTLDAVGDRTTKLPPGFLCREPYTPFQGQVMRTRN
jgi:hypothetical protein